MLKKEGFIEETASSITATNKGFLVINMLLDKLL
jgi:hypothetical protein